MQSHSGAPGDCRLFSVVAHSAVGPRPRWACSGVQSHSGAPGVVGCCGSGSAMVQWSWGLVAIMLTLANEVRHDSGSTV